MFCILHISSYLGGLRSSHGNYSDEQLARISQINGSFTHSVSRLFQVSQHHPRGRKGVQGSPAYREKVFKFIDEYRKDKLFTCPKRRRVGTGVGQNFICAYCTPSLKRATKRRKQRAARNLPLNTDSSPRS